MMNTYLEDAISQFNSITKKPELFLSDPNSIITNIQTSLKQNYDYTKKEEPSKGKTTNTLPELIIKNFDVEQIWQQIELQNDSFLNNSILHISRLTAAKDSSLWFDIDGDEEEEAEEVNENEDKAYNSNPTSEAEEKVDQESSDDSEYEDLSDEKEVKNDKKIKKKKINPSAVDDKFFKLGEMEEFLKQEERDNTKQKNESDSEEEAIDLFDPDIDDDDSEEETKNPKYNDFFGDHSEDIDEDELNNDTIEEEEDEDNGGGMEDKILNNRKSKENESSGDSNEDDSENDEKETKSSYEIREERLQKKIKELEEKTLQDKPWQLKGEITASNRPQNSLLEEVVEFDLTTRPAPVITQETTFKLEDVIKQRIKDKAFDDVERKIKPVDEPTEYRKKLILDQEKSKHSLAQIYESEYLKAKDELDPNLDKSEEEPKEHVEIRQMMKELFSKLDALSNFHFTPKPVAPELKIINNLPAINMEEVAPIAVSDATLLAPEEIKNKPKGDLIGKEERTKTDKKRDRRKKKTKQKIHAMEKEKKATVDNTNKKLTKKGTANLIKKVSKDRNVNLMKENSNIVKSSTSFFSQLEDEVKSKIKDSNIKKRKREKPHVSAKRIKL